MQESSPVSRGKTLNNKDFCQQSDIGWREAKGESKVKNMMIHIGKKKYVFIAVK